jgi:hypothetical protein
MESTPAGAKRPEGTPGGVALCGAASPADDRVSSSDAPAYIVSSRSEGETVRSGYAKRSGPREPAALSFYDFSAFFEEFFVGTRGWWSSYAFVVFTYMDIYGDVLRSGDSSKTVTETLQEVLFPLGRFILVVLTYFLSDPANQNLWNALAFVVFFLVDSTTKANAAEMESIGTISESTLLDRESRDSLVSSIMVNSFFANLLNGIFRGIVILMIVSSATNDSYYDEFLALSVFTMLLRFVVASFVAFLTKRVYRADVFRVRRAWQVYFLTGAVHDFFLLLAMYPVAIKAVYGSWTYSSTFCILYFLALYEYAARPLIAIVILCCMRERRTSKVVPAS